ncbi:hypothetical protein F383_39485 [Gossypium arboreum]|uniref:Uncharacterized protein n=1 Tax=Gossypium arboreum TaxID=29729 RepID=A0A0B0MY84_GOSAR|nr:hypothetical protein F383_39485 [Gossypium arboreum]
MNLNLIHKKTHTHTQRHKVLQFLKQNSSW